MAILAECDICGAQHRVKDALVGTSIRCKECGVSIKVLNSSLVNSREFIEENGSFRRREPQRDVGVWPWMVAIMVSAVVVAFLVAIVWGVTVLLEYR
jgi:hypothetical protein